MGVHLFAIQMGDENGALRRAHEKRFIYDLMRDFVGSKDMNDPEIGVEAWWDADDDRSDRSDCDSAVFVPMSTTAQVYRHLANEALTGRWNVPLEAPQVERGEATVHQRLDFLSRLTAMHGEYSRATGGRDLIDDWRFVAAVEDVIDSDEDLPEDRLQDTYRTIKGDYVMGEAHLPFLDGGHTGDAVWDGYMDRVRDHYSERAETLRLRS